MFVLLSTVPFRLLNSCLESGHKKVAGVYLNMKELYHSTFLNCEHIYNYSFELSSLAGLALCCN